ncbi:nitrogen regulation protein NR(II), partial [Spirochaetota bacterium]
TKNRGVVTYEFMDTDISETSFFSISSEGIYLTDTDKGKYFHGTQGIARDITKRKFSEKALDKSEEDYFIVIESLVDGYYEMDKDGNFTYINEALAGIAGYEKYEVIGRHYRMVFDSEVLEDAGKVFDRIFKTGKPEKIVDLRIIRKDGKMRYIEGSISLIYDIDGSPVGFRGIARDFTERFKMEQEVIRARKLEAVGIFAGGIAHDYNNALTAILGNLALAKMDVDPAKIELLDILNDAETASLRVMELTQKLSTFAKGGKPVLKISEVKKIVEDVCEEFKKKFPGVFSIEISNELWSVEIDELQIRHVLEYILENTMEALNNKGNIWLTAENVKVEKEEYSHEISLQAAEYVKVSIRDDGPGIKKSDIEKVFDPYFTTKQGKSGMGLAICYAIIKRHHGYIDVSSEEKKGTVFNIYLPVTT